jgi:hypothetical protein
VVDPKPDQSAVGAAVGDDRHRHVDPAGLPVQVEDHLLECTSLGDHIVDPVERDVARREPRTQVGDVHLERPRAQIPPV